MTQKDTSGPAYPAIDAKGVHYPGMTLRDYFAGQALAGLLGGRGGPIQREFILDDAKLALEYADAMIAARKETT